MTTLHTINKPVQTSAALNNAQAALLPGDTLLFIEDGVLSLMNGSQSNSLIKELNEKHPVTALLADIEARGLSHHMPEWVKIVDYNGFVELTETHAKTLSWT